MAFSAFGRLGSGGAAGFLAGMETASQRMDKVKHDRDSVALATYSKLLESGEWEPVGKDGAPDGGVLRIGNVGLLKRRKVGVDPLTQLKMLTERSKQGYYSAQEKKALRPEKPDVSMQRVTFKDGRQALIPVPKGQGIELEPGATFGARTPTYKYWKLPDGSVKAIEGGAQVPAGATPVGTGGQITEKLVLLHEDTVLEDRLRDAKKELATLRWVVDLPKEKIKPGFMETQRNRGLELMNRISTLEARRDELSKLLGNRAGVKERALQMGPPVGGTETKTKPDIEEIVKEPETAEETFEQVKKKIAAIMEAAGVSVKPKKQGRDYAYDNIQLPKKKKKPTGREKYLAPKKKQVVRKKMPPRPSKVGKTPVINSSDLKGK